MSSVNIRRILGLVLALGNYMNGGEFAQINLLRKHILFFSSPEPKARR